MSLSSLLAALEFAARKHRNHRRKDAEASPYVNHLIAVARVLVEEGGVTDEALLVAAVLHDTVEDTESTFEELERHFGAEVTALVREVTDDKALEKAVRKEQQIAHAAQSSPKAKQLKIADKIANIRDIIGDPPTEWSTERKTDYLAWAERVVAGCRGVNPDLDRAFDAVIIQGKGASRFASR